MLKIEAQKHDRTDLYRKSPKEADCANLITESCQLWNEGQCKALYITGLPNEDLRKAVQAVDKISSNRRQSGVASQSRVFGYQPRMPVQQRDYCAQATLNRDYPRTYEVLKRKAAEFSQVYERFFPENHALSVAAINTVKPCWRIPGSVFTSGIINKDNPLQYHYDAGNFENTWSVMAVFKKGTAGGALILPDYDVKLECSDNSLLIFDGQSELHGVTPIMKTQQEAYRFSVVFYSLEAICRCGNPQEELRRAQVSRTKVEMKRAGILK